MSSLNILIIGTGICGPALATLLQRSNPAHKIHLIERSPSLRTTGQQIDLKLWAPDILSRLGVLPQIRAACVNETGFEVVDRNDRRVAHFGVTKAELGTTQGLSTEYEIMRGSVVEVLYAEMGRFDSEVRREKGEGKVGGITSEFGKTVERIEQEGETVRVGFSDGSEGVYDLVVGADGQGSRTRRMVVEPEVEKGCWKSLGIHGAYFTMEKAKGEDTLARGYCAPGRRWAAVRPSGRPATGALIFQKEGKNGASERLTKCYGKGVEEQKAAFIEAFQGCGWQEQRLLEGMKNADDFYISEIAQIKLKSLVKGRVVLLGDAGHAPSPFTGYGTTLSLLGSYILAGEIARRPNDIPSALAAYDKNMRPYIDECQQISPRTMDFFFPTTGFGVWILHQVFWFFAKLSQLFLQGDEPATKHSLPQYAELNLP